MFSAGDVETVTRLRPPAKDRFGDPVPGSTADLDIAGCLFAPGGSSENVEGANQVSTDGTVYAPAGTDITATDRLRVRGHTYEVVGQPQTWSSTGLVVSLRRVTG